MIEFESYTNVYICFYSLQMSDSDITAVLQKLSDSIDSVKDGQADIMKRWVDLESQTGADINNESEDDNNNKEHENNCDKGVNSKEGYEKSGSESDEELLYFAGTQIDKWGPEIDKKIAIKLEMDIRLLKSQTIKLSQNCETYSRREISLH